MSQKRDFSDLEDGEVSDGDSTPVAASEEQPGHQQQQQPEPKRLKTNSSRHRHQHAGIDATWGQKSVFSGGDIKRGTTTIPDGLDDDFEDDSDAMAYLAAVRCVESSPFEKISPVPVMLKVDFIVGVVAERFFLTLFAVLMGKYHIGKRLMRYRIS